MSKYRYTLEDNNTEQEVNEILDDIESDLNSILRMFECEASQFDISDVYSAIDKLTDKLH